MSDSDGGVEITSHHENPSYHDPVDASTYVSALDAKVGELERLFSPLLQQASVPILNAEGIDRGVAVRPEVFSSPPLHFRSRCRFQVMWDDATVTAESIGTSPRETATPGRRLSYRMWNKGEPTVSIDEFPMALRVIETLMPAVLREAEAQPELGDGLQAIHFLASRGARGGMLVTMVYDRPIDEGWKIAAEGPRARLKSVMEDIRAEVYAAGDRSGTDAAAGARGDDDDEFEATSLNILGRSRGTQIVVGDACHVFERLTLRDGRTLTY
jgi:tRNA/tmRNA/rRNA uracil-C5-methylase (TrmA/RlmC/RlmD family)